MAVLPAPRNAPQVRPPLLVLAILAVLLMLLFGSGRVGVVTNSSEPTQAATVLTSALRGYPGQVGSTLNRAQR